MFSSLLHAAVIYTLFLPLSFFSFEAHWLFEPTSPSLIGPLVMGMRYMDVGGAEEGCACAGVTGIDFVYIYYEHAYYIAYFDLLQLCF